MTTLKERIGAAIRDTREAFRPEVERKKLAPSHEVRRAEPRLSAAQLARSIGMHPSTFAGVETGTRAAISVGQMRSVSEQLGTKPTVILRSILVEDEGTPIEDLPLENIVQVLRYLPKTTRMRVAHQLLDASS